MRAYRLFLCIEIIVIGLPYLAFVEHYNILLELNLFWNISIITALMLVPFFVFFKSKVNPHIAFFESHIEVPRYFFWIRNISFESIISLEEIKFGDIEFGIIVGLRNGAIVHYDEDMFKNEEGYLKFKRNISDILVCNAQSLDVNTIKIESLSWDQNILLILISGLFLVVLLQLTYDDKLDFYTSLGMGALTKTAILGEQAYRIAASFFLHINSFHLSMNIATLALFGQFLLRVVDLYRFLCIFLLSAFLASLFTLALSPYEAIIGASGGIMGVFGAYCCLKLLRYLPGSISSSSNVWILLFIAVQVALEYFVEGIDSYTHAGGFLTGFVYMWFCIKNEKEHSVFQSSAIEKVAACVLTALYLGGLLVFFSKVYGGI